MFFNVIVIMLPSFFEKLPVDRLLGEGVVPSDVNDDVLGRTLDAIYKCDATDQWI